MFRGMLNREGGVQPSTKEGSELILDEELLKWRGRIFDGKIEIADPSLKSPSYLEGYTTVFLHYVPTDVCHPERPTSSEPSISPIGGKGVQFKKPTGGSLGGLYERIEQVVLARIGESNTLDSQRLNDINTGATAVCDAVFAETMAEYIGGGPIRKDRQEAERAMRQKECEEIGTRTERTLCLAGLIYQRENEFASVFEQRGMTFDLVRLALDIEEVFDSIPKYKSADIVAIVVRRVVGEYDRKIPKPETGLLRFLPDTFNRPVPAQGPTLSGLVGGVMHGLMSMESDLSKTQLPFATESEIKNGIVDKIEERFNQMRVEAESEALQARQSWEAKQRSAAEKDMQRSKDKKVKLEAAKTYIRALYFATKEALEAAGVWGVDPDIIYTLALKLQSWLGRDLSEDEHSRLRTILLNEGAFYDVIKANLDEEQLRKVNDLYRERVEAVMVDPYHNKFLGLARDKVITIAIRQASPPYLFYDNELRADDRQGVSGLAKVVDLAQRASKGEDVTEADYVAIVESIRHLPEEKRQPMIDIVEKLVSELKEDILRHRESYLRWQARPERFNHPVWVSCVSEVMGRGEFQKLERDRIDKLTRKILEKVTSTVSSLNDLDQLWQQHGTNEFIQTNGYSSEPIPPNSY